MKILFRVPVSKAGIGTLWYYRAPYSKGLDSPDMEQRNAAWNLVPPDDLLKHARENDSRDNQGDFVRSSSLRKEDMKWMQDLCEMIFSSMWL